MHLMVRDNEYVISVEGDTLMSSRTHGSEEALATLACQRVHGESAPGCSSGDSGWGSRFGPHSISLRQTRS